MVDWTSSIQRTFEYYVVDPKSWRDTRMLSNVKSCTINRDSSAETLGSAAIDITESVGECYVRVYMITIQNGVREKHPLGTFLVQTPSSGFDGKVKTMSMDAYTPLIELKENPPPIGYYVPKNENIMDMAYRLTREHLRAPVVKPVSSTTLYHDFVADTSDTWCSFLTDLIANDNYTFSLDEMGRVLFAPVQSLSTLQPVWTYNDDNSSILLPNVTMDHDLYGIPNAVEVVYSNGSVYRHAKAINNNANSPISTVNRGREILHRITDPNLVGNQTEEQVQEYAEQMLDALSSIECSVTYSHGYCPVRLSDCVRLNYSRAGLKNIKAKVVSQSIKCDTDCQVTETAIYTTNLRR